MKHIYDLALASYLVTIGHKFIKTQPDGRKTIFVFQESEKLEADILSYFNRQATVPAPPFAETMRNLKAMVLKG